MKHAFYECGTLTIIVHHCRRVMLFIFALPVMQVILFCLAIGRDPIGLHLAVVNHELNQSGANCEFNDACSFKMLSCRYLQNLDNDTIIKVSVSSYRIPYRKWESCGHLGIKICKTCLLVLPYLPVLMYESDSWSVTLGGEHRLRPVKDRVPRKNRPKGRRLEKTVEQVLHDMCSPQCFI